MIVKSPPPRTYTPLARPVKHRVFKLSGQWYYMCGRCPEANSSKGWRQAIDLLAVHADEHKG